MALEWGYAVVRYLLALVTIYGMTQSQPPRHEKFYLLHFWCSQIGFFKFLEEIW